MNIYSLQYPESEDDYEQDTPSASFNIIDYSGHQFSINQLDNITEHMICYMDKKDNKLATYPKCSACKLPDHTVENCHPLINIALAQSFLQK